MIEKSESVNIKFPVTTIVTVLATLLFVHLMTSIAPLILPLVISALIAVALMPILEWLEKKNVRRGIAITLMVLAFGLALAGLVSAILPNLYHEAVALRDQLPQLKDDLLKKLGPDNPLNELISSGLNREDLFPKTEQLKQVFLAGNILFGGLSEFVLVFVMTVYLVIDGPRVVKWLRVFFSPSNQQKFDATNTEISKIVSAYIIGQFITSLLSFLFALCLLNILRVPNALLLATLAGLLDILPVLGFLLAVIPAMIFAIGVSPSTPWIVLGAYTLYHVIENYFIVPYVYGNRMRVSSFVVFFSLIAAGLVAGIEGAIVILPIIASYPVIERIWLKNYVRKEAVVEHSS